VVQKFGSKPRNIDTAACAARGIKVLTIRRRANIACAEHALALMLMLARKLNRVGGRISVEQLSAIGYPYRPFDRRHTPNSNWPRISGLSTLNGATLGIIGLGEIGREIAIRAAAFGMRILYHQRSRLPPADEQELGAVYKPLQELLALSDWVVPQLPSAPDTLGFIGGAELAQMKPGAFLVNVARAEIIDRAALIDALKCGRLGGFALDPLYEEPGRSDDELLQFDNVVLSPHVAGSPRGNALDDLAEMMEGLARELAP
jgi:phosphoglycerate dehydrogenase-like enzyme